MSLPKGPRLPLALTWVEEYSHRRTQVSVQENGREPGAQNDSTNLPHILPIQNHLARIPRAHRLKSLFIVAPREAVGNQLADVKSRLQHHRHLVPGLIHLAAI